MRIRRVLTLLVVVALTGLLSGAAGGAASTAGAALTAVVGSLPAQFRDNGWAPGTVAVPAAVPVAAVPVAAVPVAAVPVAAASIEPAAAPRVGEPAVVEEPAAPVVEEAEEPADPRAVSGTPCESTARACIELSSNQAWLIRDGEVSYGPVPITHGRKSYRTPPGTFDVDFRNRDHVSSIYDSPMPYSVFFNGGIAFHEGSLNEKSHGCIHLSRAAAREFFDSLRRGDLVQVVS